MVERGEWEGEEVEEVGDLFVISVIKSSGAEVVYHIGAGTIVTNRISTNLWSACQPATIRYLTVL